MARARSSPSPVARFQVDPRLATLLGEGYRSSEQALKELVDNGWDADARRVVVELPEPLKPGPIIIRDDGTGMTDREVRNEYLVVANDRRTRKGERTAVLHRPVKGRKGIGKFAGLMTAEVMVLETRARGVQTTLEIRKEDLLKRGKDLENIDLPLTTSPCDTAAHGTTITLTHLNQALAYPSAERLKQLLMLEYGRQEDFEIVVNGQPVTIDDIPGETFSETVDLEGTGSVRLRFTISDGKKPLKQSGIAVRVGGKIVGRPGFFGLDADDRIPTKLLRKVYGEIEADGLAQDVTADWGAIIENSHAYRELERWAAERLRTRVGETFKRELNLAAARRELEIKRRLAELPEYRRRMAEDAIQRILLRFYGESEERIDAVVGVTLEAFERDEYWLVVKAIGDAKPAGVQALASALGQFGLVDMAVVGHQARRRLEVLAQMEELLSTPATLEREMHHAIERNLWVLGSSYATMSSNETTRSVLKRWADKKFTGPRAKKRPDLLLCQDVRGRYLLIEFKRPSHALTRDDETQAVRYRDDLRTTFDPIEIILLGRGMQRGIDPRSSQPDLKFISYARLAAHARAELEWLVNQLRAEHATEHSAGGVQLPAAQQTSQDQGRAT